MCFRGHIEDVYDLSWTNDGNFLVSGSVDNTAIMWDIQKGDDMHYMIASLCLAFELKLFKLCSAVLLTRVLFASCRSEDMHL